MLDTATTISTGEPDATESGHVRFGGGPSEKDQHHWHLVGGLPYGTPGSGGGSGKRTGGNTGTAPGVYLTGSGSVVSAQLASHVFTIAATAERAGLNPLAYLTAYLQECAQSGGSGPTGAALTRFLPWAASTDDLTAWAHNPHRRPRSGPEPDTTEPDTGSDARPAGNQRSGPAP